MQKKFRIKEKHSPLGLDIGSRYIKMVQLSRKRGGIFLSRYGIAEMPEQMFDNGQVVAPEDLSKHIADFLRRKRVRQKKVNLSLAGQSMIVRQIEMPVMTAKELSEAIRWEAEKHILIPVEEAIVDYIVLGEKEGREGRIQQILLVAAAREVINGYMKTALALGLYPLAIEVQPLALIRLLNTVKRFSREKETTAGSIGEDEDILLLDLGWETTNLIVIEKGKYSFSRVLGIGSSNFVAQNERSSSVAGRRALKASFTEASLAQPRAQEAADLLLKDIQRSLEFYFMQTGNREKKVDRLCFIGDGGKISGLAAFLSEELRLETVFLNPFSFISHDQRFIASDLQEDASLLGVATGLALREWLV